MFVIYGVRSVNKEGPVISTEPCGNCGNTEHLTYGTQGYFHLFWIPMFGLPKIVGLQCTKCQKITENKNLYGDMAKTLRKNLFGFAHNILMFIGIILIALIGSGIFLSAKLDTLKENQMLSVPEAGDIYIVDFSKLSEDEEVDEEYKYGALRVESVASEGEIDLLVSTYAYSYSSGVEDDIDNGKALQDDYYENVIYTITREDLDNFRESNAIISVVRK